MHHFGWILKLRVIFYFTIICVGQEAGIVNTYLASMADINDIKTSLEQVSSAKC